MWASNEQGSAQGCEHTIAIIPDNPSGIELTPLYLRFEAERGGTLPADQKVQLWTGGGLAMPWTAVPDAWWLDARPASGSQATQIAVRPNSTQLAEGMHATELVFAATPPARKVEVQYIITKSTSAGEPPMALSLVLDAWPQPAAVRGMLQVRITDTGSSAIRLSLYDPLGRERLSVYAESGSVLQLPLDGLSPGLYWLRAHGKTGMVTRAVVLR
ncbi:MAG: hypothetical protein C0600_05850 [Ignavibacteria bacterium]|nr:MAG: hypothetical protein C0600_05850 [Ignavibacteria bacterium]